MKSIFLVIASMVLLQSCAVYFKESISINQAVEVGAVKVVVKSGREMTFKEVIHNENNYYGKKGKKVWRIDSTSVTYVYIKDVEKSNKRRFWMQVSSPFILAGVFVLGFIIYANMSTVE